MTQAPTESSYLNQSTILRPESGNSTSGLGSIVGKIIEGYSQDWVGQRCCLSGMRGGVEGAGLPYDEEHLTTVQYGIMWERSRLQR